MREAVKRARWLALTLSIACVGAMSYPAPSTHPGTDEESSVLLQDGTLVSALPTPPALLVVPTADTPTQRDRRIPASPAFQDPAPPTCGVRRPTVPAPPAPREADSLLGLRAHPANAPPLL